MTPRIEAGLTSNEIEERIVPHGPNRECSDPGLCTALTEFRVAIEREAAIDAERLARAIEATPGMAPVAHRAREIAAAYARLAAWPDR